MQDRFTVYDVFAVLVPGMVFIYLLAFTLDHIVGIQIFDWTGGVGDATLLLIFGYAAGTLLQAIGSALVERMWRRIRGGPYPAGPVLGRFCGDESGKRLTPRSP